MKHYGIVGHPVTQSLSKVMHEAAFKTEGIDADYSLWDMDPNDPEALANFCYETSLNHIEGFSVTMPFKEELMAYMDYYDPITKKIGALNTVKNENNELIGYNTDATGALQALLEKTPVKEKRVLILGAGGAARAIAYSLKEYGAQVAIYNRTPEKAENLAKELQIEAVELSDIKPDAFDIIINATPLGMKPDEDGVLITAPQIGNGAVLMDIITSPLETRLIQEGKKAGAQIITGERMLLFQATGQFEIWFNKPAPLKAMEEALYAELRKRGLSK